MTTPGAPSKNVLNADVEIKGNLKCSGDLVFEGKLEGDLHCEGGLQLAETSVVHGNLSVGSVVARGKIAGNINAKDKIEVKAKTELFGDIRAAKLVIEEGVTFVGKSEVNPNKLSPTAGAPKAVEAPKPESPLLRPPGR